MSICQRRQFSVTLALTPVAERRDDGSRGLQPTVASAGLPRRGATLERWRTSKGQTSLRDAGRFGCSPWAKAHGYLQVSRCDKNNHD